MNARTKDEAPSREREEDEIQYGVRRENKNGERAMGVRFNPVKISINKKKIIIINILLYIYYIYNI